MFYCVIAYYSRSALRLRIKRSRAGADSEASVLKASFGGFDAPLCSPSLKIRGERAPRPPVPTPMDYHSILSYIAV